MRSLLLTVALLAFGSAASACDVCGRSSGSAKFFYWRNISRITLLPNAGVFADASLPNRDGHTAADGPGGFIALATAGLDVYAGRFSTGFTFQQPVYQNLGEGKIQAHSHWMATLNYIF